MSDKHENKLLVFKMAALRMLGVRRRDKFALLTSERLGVKKFFSRRFNRDSTLGWVLYGE